MKKRHDINIAYIGGGSKGWAWALMSDLALEEQLGGTVKLYDIDQQAAQQNEKIGNRLLDRPEAVGKWTYQAVNTLEEALHDAHFVIISILPGTFKEMASDVHVPEEYGIYQAVGDTVGPGGIVRALRTIPMYVHIAEQIKAHAPQAWVINYTNPMSLCVRTMYEVFPQIKAFGCCHEVFGTQSLLADMVNELDGFSGVTRQDIKTNVLGINHFTWVDHATYEGLDLLPLYEQFAERYYETGFEKVAGRWQESTYHFAHRVKFDLFQKFGLIAAAGDRHLAEFMPLSWYLRDRETIAHWKFHITPVADRMRDQQQKIEQGDKLASGELDVELKRSGEEGVLMMKALLGMGDFITNVNLPNVGQMTGLPLGAVVETNAVLTGDSIKPVVAGKLPLPIENIVNRHILNQETTLQAVLNEDKELAFQAFVNDPLVTLAPQQARQLFEQMLSHTNDYLPEGLKGRVE